MFSSTNTLTDTQRAQIRAQHVAQARARQDGRIQTRRQHAGAPWAEASRLKARADRLERWITYDPARNNAVISDPVLAVQVRAAVYAHNRAAWRLVDNFIHGRIPDSRALVPAAHYVTPHLTPQRTLVFSCAPLAESAPTIEGARWLATFLEA